MIKLLFAHTLSKDGSFPEENEDAYLVSDDVAVICDGVSESVFAAEWAQALCTYGSEKFDPNGRGIVLCGEEFQKRMLSLNHPWYVRRKLVETGAAATFLRVGWNRSLDNSELLIHARGDSCAIMLNENGIEWSFPVERSEDFCNTPLLVFSQSAFNSTEGEFFSAKRVNLSDTKGLLCLSTDAWAQYLLTNGNDKDIFLTLHELRDPNVFVERVRYLRKNGKLKNDDVTLLVFEIS